MMDPTTKTASQKPPVPPQVARTDHYSPSNIIHNLHPSISRSCMVSLVLCGLVMFVVTTDFLCTLRVTPVSLDNVRIGKNQSDIDPTIGNSNGVHKGEREVQDSSYRPPPLKNRDSFSADDVKRMEKQLIYTIHETAQRTIEPRGIVLPLFDKIATLGVSLILELRAIDVHLPIEIPHCGDLKGSTIRTIMEKEEAGVLHFYNVCELASKTASLREDASVKVFCQSLSNCHKLFRGFDIKLLAVILSRFEEVMLLDADTLFFMSPMSLWNTDKYQSTGTLFFHDRIVEDKMYMSHLRKNSNGDVRQIHDFMSRFDVSPFKPLGHIERPKATSENKVPVTLNFSPSEQLLTSHSWNYRSGHEVDSSLVLWNKKRQPRATAILGAFIARNRVGRPPSYGDKELFFVATELAETQYAFSDFGTGAAGQDLRDDGPGKSVLCGNAAHYYPIKPKDERLVANASVLYLNSDDILVYDPKTKPIYYTQARLSEFYPGNVTERGLLNICPFNVTGVRFSPEQEDHISLRQHFHEIAKAWIE